MHYAAPWQLAISSLKGEGAYFPFPTNVKLKSQSTKLHNPFSCNRHYFELFTIFQVRAYLFFCGILRHSDNISSMPQFGLLLGAYSHPNSSHYYRTFYSQISKHTKKLAAFINHIAQVGKARHREVK